MPRKLELTNIDTNSTIGFSDVNQNDSEEPPKKYENCNVLAKEANIFIMSF